MELGLTDRVAVVTGSSRGIGKAIALGFAREGAKTVICARNREELNATEKEIKQTTRTEILALEVDLTRKNDIQNLIQSTLKEFGRIDILVANTGGPEPVPFVSSTESQWKYAYDQMFASVLNLLWETIPHMKMKHWGRIICMTSIAAKQPVENLVLSNALRAGILGLVKTLSSELAESGILVNSVCPGYTLTNRVEDLARSEEEKTGEPRFRIIEKWSKAIPLRRMADPREIADVVVFLASERASYVTGTVTQVDGGWIRGII